MEPELDAMEMASTQPQGGLREILKSKHLRRILLLACMLQVINQGTCLLFFSLLLVLVVQTLSNTRPFFFTQTQRQRHTQTQRYTETPPPPMRARLQ